MNKKQLIFFLLMIFVIYSLSIVFNYSTGSVLKLYERNIHNNIKIDKLNYTTNDMINICYYIQDNVNKSYTIPLLLRVTSENEAKYALHTGKGACGEYCYLFKYILDKDGIINNEVLISTSGNHHCVNKVNNYIYDCYNMKKYKTIEEKIKK